jgi:hypothetical protein
MGIGDEGDEWEMGDKNGQARHRHRAHCDHFRLLLSVIILFVPSSPTHPHLPFIPLIPISVDFHLSHPAQAESRFREMT